MSLFNENGEFLGTIPEECVRDCTQPGVDAFNDVAKWVTKLEFVVPRDKAIAYLSEFGNWNDLTLVSQSTLAIRVLWVACWDIYEQGEWMGLVH